MAPGPPPTKTRSDLHILRDSEGIDHVRAGTMLIVLGCMLFEDTELTTAVLSCNEPRSNELMP